MAQIKQEYLLNEFQFKIQYAKINSMKYVKDLEKAIRDLIPTEYNSKYCSFRYLYSADDYTKKEQKTFEYVYRLLMLAFKKFKEKTQKELPEKIIYSYKKIQENILFIIFENDVTYSYNQIVEITKDADCLYFKWENRILFNFIKICKSNIFDINYIVELRINSELINSNIENKEMIILLEFKYKELNNSNDFTIWNELYKRYMPSEEQTLTQQNIDKYKLQIKCIKEADNYIKNNLEKYIGEN